jgi:hypothetical protein
MRSPSGPTGHPACNVDGRSAAVTAAVDAEKAMGTVDVGDWADGAVVGVTTVDVGADVVVATAADVDVGAAVVAVGGVGPESRTAGGVAQAAAARAMTAAAVHALRLPGTTS